MGGHRRSSTAPVLDFRLESSELERLVARPPGGSEAAVREHVLRRADILAVLGFLADMGDIAFDRPYPPAVVARLRELIPCASAHYEEVDCTGRRSVVVIDDVAVLADDPDEDALYWTLGPCPIVGYRSKTRDLSAVRLTDVTSWPRYRESSIYRDYFAPVRIEHMIDVGLQVAPSLHRSFTLYRRAGDGNFSRRDQAILELLRPHFGRLERVAALRRQLSERVPARVDLDQLQRSIPLTPREREIIAMVAQGKTNAQIGVELWIAPSTVKKHLEHVYEKLGVGSRAAAAVYGRS